MPATVFTSWGDGELNIDAGGLHSTAHRADYFGEIALLRDVPRTASVAAAVDSHLYALQRDDFLAAVTGHSVAHAAGQEVAETRLAQTGTERVKARVPRREARLLNEEFKTIDQIRRLGNG